MPYRSRCSINDYTHMYIVYWSRYVLWIYDLIQFNSKHIKVCNEKLSVVSHLTWVLGSSFRTGKSQANISSVNYLYRELFLFSRVRCGYFSWDKEQAFPITYRKWWIENQLNTLYCNVGVYPKHLSFIS